MTKCLLFALLFFAFVNQTTAQNRIVPAPNLPVDSVTHRIRFANTIPVPGVSAAELQARAREWVALTFQDAHQVTQLDDAGRGVLILRGYTNLWEGINGIGASGRSRPLAFTLRLDFRDGRYHYEAYDLGWADVPGGPTSGPATDYSAQAIASWQSGALATIEASPRQRLLQPEYAPNPKDYDLAARYGRDWPALSSAIYQAMKNILVPLREHATAAPVKF